MLLARVSAYGKAMGGAGWACLDDEAAKVAAAAAALEAATKLITETSETADGLSDR